MKTASSKAAATDITTDRQLNEALAAQSLREYKWARNHLRVKRIIGVLTILFFLAAYLQWHYSQGQSTYLLDILIIGSMVNLFILSVENIFSSKP